MLFDSADLQVLLQIAASDVVLPEGAVFVIANSLTVSNKAETAAGRYNMRVVECKLATAVLAVTSGKSKVHMLYSGIRHELLTAFDLFQHSPHDVCW